MGAFSSSHGLGTGLTGAHAQTFFALVTIVGLVLIIVWGARFANREQLKHAITWLLMLGIVGMLITLPLARLGSRWMSWRDGPRPGVTDVRPGGKNDLKGRSALPASAPTQKSASSAARK